MKSKIYNSNKLDLLIKISIYAFCFSIFTSMALINFSVIFTILLFSIKIFFYKNENKFEFYGFLNPMILFSLSIIFSGINHWNNEILSNKFMFSFLFFFILVNEVSDFKTIKKMIYSLLISSVIASIYGLYQYFFLDYSRIKSFSFSLTFGNLMAVMVIFLSVYIIWGKISLKTRLLFLIVDFVFFINLLLTKSRGAWLGFIIGIILLAIIKSRKLLIFFIIGLLLFSLLLPTDFIQRFKSSFNISYDVKNNRSNTYRIAMWITALKIMKEYPIFGLGYYNYRTPLSEPYKLDIIKSKGQFIHVHNTFLEIGAEQGLFGLLTFIYLIYFIYKKLIFLYIEETNINKKLFVLGTIISVTIFIVQGLTQYNFGKTEPLSLFILMISMSLIIIKSNKYNSGRDKIE